MKFVSWRNFANKPNLSQIEKRGGDKTSLTNGRPRGEGGFGRSSYGSEAKIIVYAWVNDELSGSIQDIYLSDED